MSLLQLPKINAAHGLSAIQFDMRPDALERWEPGIRAAADDDGPTISIYDRIGESYDGEGVTTKRISAALRNIGARDVTVNVNSPGGDFFQGVAIYNLLREHKAKVTVKVMGIAASAASVIAMAGDEILMGDGAFLMIHNAWAMAIGNRHDMIKASEQLAPFDAAMASVYAARSGLGAAEAAAMMDKESWIGAAQAVEQGFASGILEREQLGHDPEASADTKYLAMVEAAMARAGHSRSVRREAIKSLFSGMPGAAGKIATPSAGTKEVAASLQTLINNLKGKK
ncbi:Clp protease ClpP [Janthinobacterium sp. PLB04]|uniref:ATP-dependent Clp protease proteolytic subunit n=1 Tax=Janthinobacterium lividum TaxID=29581 RepID=A0AAJ4T6U2_9BURK|nr:MULTISPECIES: head maturation protease, ClpP-related [Janthinobacterium]KAB0331769.1 Clp protease ClpP [Janthinobacterium lividum]QSX97969.1 Clp protease ClpP [Janthinobacterium lividum]UGQ37940.1 Clp protease ClpP [Janthinobacterium sp. PLB04]